MAEIEFTARDVDSLAKKLDTVGKDLEERERAMLLAVFRLAGDQLAESTNVGGGRFEPKANAFKVTTADKLPSLANGFKNSFKPGVGGRIDPGVAAVEWD